MNIGFTFNIQTSPTTPQQWYYFHFPLKKYLPFACFLNAQEQDVQCALCNSPTNLKEKMTLPVNALPLWPATQMVGS